MFSDLNRLRDWGAAGLKGETQLSRKIVEERRARRRYRERHRNRQFDAAIGEVGDYDLSLIVTGRQVTGSHDGRNGQWREAAAVATGRNRQPAASTSRRCGRAEANRRVVGIRDRENLAQRLGAGKRLGKGQSGYFLECLSMERARQSDDQSQSDSGEEDMQLIRFRGTITHRNAPFFCDLRCEAARRGASLFMPLLRLFVLTFALRKPLSRTVMRFFNS